MAFILKSSKLIHSLIECSRQRAVTSTRKNVFISVISRPSVIQKVTARSAVSLAAQEQNSNLDIEQTLFRLSGDIRNKRVYLENVKEVFDVIKQKGEITESQFILLLRCCSEVSFMSSSEERIQFAEEIWKSAADFGIELNINHYNALLSVFLDNNHKFSPSEFLKELEEKDIKPNLVTHRRILKAFCQKGDIKGASSVLEKMKNLNFPLSEEDFNALIQCHCELGEFQKAKEILKVMKEREIEPTGKTYLNLLRGYAKHGEIKKLMDELEKLNVNETYLSCSDFLEIIYTLAVNKQSQHIDKILQKLTDGYEKIISSKLIIQRLLHQKRDSIAFQLFEGLIKLGEESNYILSHSKFIIRHFVLYRKPAETLDLCKELEEKGWAKAAVGYALNQVYCYKDENFCINFLRTMVQKNIHVRSHYFWPLLIKASEKGNSKLFEILSIIPPRALAVCQYTTTKIVFPNYKFSGDWQADYEELQKAGIPRKWLSTCFLEKFVMEKKIEEVERLCSRYPVDVEHYGGFLFPLVEYVQAHPEEVERFVNILYYFAHDFKMKYERDSADGEESSPESSTKNIFDVVVAVFLKGLNDKKVFEQVLQKMLERKLGISTKKASAIIESPELSDLADLAKKLSDPGLQYEYDDNLLKLKAYPNRSRKGSYYKQFKEDDEINIEELQEELAEDGSFYKTLHSVRNMIRIKRYEDAIKLAKVLGKSKEELTDTSKKRLYFLIINELYSCDQYDWAEEAFYLGVDMGMLKLNDYITCINNLFKKGNNSLAVAKYCRHLEKTKNTSKCLEFLIFLVSKGSEDDLRLVMTPMVKLLGKDLFMTYLALAFVESGNLTKAKKLLETKKFNLMEQNFYYHCNVKAKWGSSKELENCLKLVKDIDFFDRIPLYKILIKKYAEEENIEKVKNLWLLIEEDDISDFSFLEKMRELMDKPSVEGLKAIADTFQVSRPMSGRERKRVAS